MNEDILNEARTMIAGFIANRRKELGITQLELANRSGMGEATIQRIESGKFWINLKQFLILCHHLDCYFFLSEKDAKDSLTTTMRERWGNKTKN